MRKEYNDRDITPLRAAYREPVESDERADLIDQMLTILEPLGA